MSRLHAAVVLAAALAASPAAADPAPAVAAVATDAGVLVFWGRDGAPVHEVWRADGAGAMRRVARVEPVRDAPLAAEILKEGRDPLSQGLTLAPDVHERAEADPRLDEVFTLASTGYARVRGAAWLDASAPRGVACRWRVVALRPGGEAVVGEATATPGRPVAPPTPAPRAEAGALRWAAAPFTGYEVRRAAERAGPYATATPLPLPARAAAGEATFADPAAPPDGATRWYQVVPRDLAGREGAPSAPVAVASPDRTPPEPPGGLQASGLTGGLALRWTPSRSPDAVAQHLYRAELTAAPGAERPSAGPRVRLTAKPLGADVTSFEDRTTRGGALYRYDVTALDAAGNESAPSAVALGAPRDAAPPATPTAFTARAGEGGAVTLSWRPVDDPDLWVYRILHAAGPKEPLRVMQEVAIGAPGAPLTVELRLDPRSQEAHRFAVAAVDRSDNESPPTPPAEVRLPDLVPPAAPIVTGLDAAAGAVTVRWAAPPEADLAGFVVTRREPGRAPVRLTGRPLAADARSFRDGDAPAGVPLAYAVAALDRAGNEGPSSEPRTTTTFAPPPAAPAGLTARAAAAGRVSLAWTPVPGSRGTMVYGAATRDGEPRQVGALVAGAALEVARGAGPFFRVQAVGASGAPSPLSAPVEAPPEVAAPPPARPATRPAGKGK